MCISGQKTKKKMYFNVPWNLGSSQNLLSNETSVNLSGNRVFSYFLSLSLFFFFLVNENTSTKPTNQPLFKPLLKIF